MNILTHPVIETKTSDAPRMSGIPEPDCATPLPPKIWVTGPQFA